MFWQGHLRQSRRHLQLPVAIHRGRVRKDGLRALWQGRVQRARDVLEHAATRAERENESSLDAVHLRRRLSQRRKHVGRRPRLRLRLRRRLGGVRLLAPDLPARRRPRHARPAQRGPAPRVPRRLWVVPPRLPPADHGAAGPRCDGRAGRGRARCAPDAHRRGRVVFVGRERLRRLGRQRKHHHRRVPHGARRRAEPRRRRVEPRRLDLWRGRRLGHRFRLRRRRSWRERRPERPRHHGG
mmetsp:Transcript_23483/g.79317  ORF Transcript_23483/g.79317 Transcript_23483/m.79317 type:complete len:240 (+) Transcript_23483:3055-3774(+)